MSSEFFPTLPGRAKVLSRDPNHRVDVFGAESGNEQRIKRGLVSLRRFRVQYGFLRSAAVYRELQKLEGFYERHNGPLDSFLWRDPQDNAVSDHGFGVGDGSRLSYQLQRALLGQVEDVLGTWEHATKPRTNWARDTWSPATGTSVTANAAVAPDNTVTAGRLRYDGSGSAGATRAVTDGSGNLTVGVEYVASIWLRAPAPVTVRVGGNLGGTTTAAVTSTWQRFSFSAAASAANARGLVSISAPAADNAPFELEVWSPQFEEGATPTRPIGIGASATVATPAYWPALGGGFQPILEPGPDLALYVEGEGLGRRSLSRVARLNRVRYSEQIDQAAWTKSLVTATTNAVAAPDGTTTAERINGTAATGEHLVEQADRGADIAAPLLANGQTAYGSVYLQAGNRTWAYVAFVQRDGATVRGAWFDLATGVVGSLQAGVTASIESVGGGWMRCKIAGSVGSGASAVRLRVQIATGDQNLIFTDDGTGWGWWAWGAMLTEGDGDYIPTAAAAVQRTDVTLGSAGVVTLAAAPRAGAALSWSGSFFRRCRFDERGVSFERWLAEVWRTGVVELVEVLS